MLEPLLRKQRGEIFHRIYLFQRLLSSDSAVIQAQPKIKLLLQANTTRIKRKVKGKFIENLFLDKFDPKILEYPQLDTLLEYQILRKHYSLVQELLSSKVGCNNSDVQASKSEKLVTAVKELEFTGFRLPREDGGFGYLSSEYTFLQEAFGTNPSLSKVISENEDFGIQLINSCGNSTQKAEFLERLASGRSTACFAHLESQPLVVKGSPSLNTTAVKTPDGYVVSGRKNWVYNASHADIIIFSANVISEDFGKEAKPVLFIADKNTPGIEIHKPYNLIGMKGLDVCEVTFTNAVIPFSSVLGDDETGDEIIKKILSTGKLNNGAQCIAIMKTLVNMAIIHCIQNKFFKRNKYERDYYKIKIGKIASRIYTVESMTYLLTGRLDMYGETDVFLESLIGKIYASENLQYVLNESLIILGSEGFSEENGLNEIIKDSQFYMTSDDTNDHLRLMLSTAGCEHMLNKFAGDNAVMRILGNISRNYFKLRWYYYDQKVLRATDVLRGHLHLMFSTESYMLETSVFILHIGAKSLLKKYGEKVFDRHLELAILADIVINIYAMTAALARASRAFCLGVKNDKVDKNVIFGEVRRMYEENVQLWSMLKDSKFSEAPKVGSGILNCKNFADQFPITEKLVIRKKSNQT